MCTLNSSPLTELQNLTSLSFLNERRELIVAAVQSWSKKNKVMLPIPLYAMMDQFENNLKSLVSNQDIFGKFVIKISLLCRHWAETLAIISQPCHFAVFACPTLPKHNLN